VIGGISASPTIEVEEEEKEEVNCKAKSFVILTRHQMALV
jgi:hypothetical protein